MRPSHNAGFQGASIGRITAFEPPNDQPLRVCLLPANGAPVYLALTPTSEAPTYVEYRRARAPAQSD